MKVQMISAKGSRKGKPFYTNRRYANALSRLGLATYAYVEAAAEVEPDVIVPLAPKPAAPVANVADVAGLVDTESVTDENTDEKPRRKYKTRRLKAEE